MAQDPSLGELQQRSPGRESNHRQLHGGAVVSVYEPSAQPVEFSSINIFLLLICNSLSCEELSQRGRGSSGQPPAAAQTPGVTLIEACLVF